MEYSELLKYLTVLSDNVNRTRENDVIELAERDPAVTYSRIHDRYAQVETYNLYSINRRRHKEPFRGLDKRKLISDFLSANSNDWRDFLKADCNYNLFRNNSGRFKDGFEDINIKRQQDNLKAISTKFKWDIDSAKAIQDEYNSLCHALFDAWSELFDVFVDCFSETSYSKELLYLFREDESLLDNFIYQCRGCNARKVGYKYRSLGKNVIQSSEEQIKTILWKNLKELHVINVEYGTFKTYI